MWFLLFFYFLFVLFLVWFLWYFFVLYFQVGLESDYKHGLDNAVFIHEEWFLESDKAIPILFC